MQQITGVAGRICRMTRTRGRTVLSRRDWGAGFVVAVFLGLSWVGVGHGAPGDLDPTFGSGGIGLSFGPSDRANALIQQPDGKLVVAGNSGDLNHMLLVRYHPNGSVDAAFGTGGKVTTTIGSGSGSNALILQPDGKLVVAGFSSPFTGGTVDVLLARFLPDGRLDATFGVGGAVTTDFGGGDEATALVQQVDGKLVIAGNSNLGINFRNTILGRYHPDGRSDDTFGIGGKVSVNLGTDGISSVVDDTVSALLLQADSKLVVTGSWLTRVTDSTLFIARFQPDGNLDPTFGQGGLVTSSEAPGPNVPSGAGRAVIQQPDEKLVVAGYYRVNSNSAPSDILLARFLPDGRVDPTFGTAGMVMTNVGADASAEALIRQPDGKLVIAGYVVGASRDMLLVRYLPDGRVDPAFGTGGLVHTDVGGGEFPSALLQQPDSRLVVAGSFGPSTLPGSTSNESAILLARYQALGCPAVTPEACLTSLAAFVTDVYQAALERSPDVGEEAYWVDLLTTEPTPDTVRGMLHVVFDGPEFRLRPVNPWQYVGALYQAMLGRDPDQAELDWWVQAVLDRLNTLLPEFIDSPEFQHLVPSCQDQAAVTLLVGRLYQQTLQRVASNAELAWWTANIATWCDLQDVAEVFFNSLEYLSVPRTLADHVTVLYRALLAREPDAGGLALWVDDLAGQLVEIEADIMASPEFEARVYRLFP